MPSLRLRYTLLRLAVVKYIFIITVALLVTFCHSPDSLTEERMMMSRNLLILSCIAAVFTLAIMLISTIMDVC